MKKTIVWNIPLTDDLRSVHGCNDFAAQWAKERTKRCYVTFTSLVVINKQVNRFTFSRSLQKTEQNGFMKYSWAVRSPVTRSTDWLSLEAYEISERNCSRIHLVSMWFAASRWLAERYWKFAEYGHRIVRWNFPSACDFVLAEIWWGLFRIGCNIWTDVWEGIFIAHVDFDEEITGEVFCQGEQNSRSNFWLQSFFSNVSSDSCCKCQALRYI
jgi:hypothetical protein